MPGPVEYRMIGRSDGGNAGGVLKIDQAMIDHGAKPVWLGYVCVDDVDETVAEVLRRGGKALMAGADVPNVGRIAMVTDPQGNPFYVMKPIPPAGDPNAKSDVFSPEAEQRVSWNELSTSDPAAARKFYGELFGWAVQDRRSGGGRFGTFAHRDAPFASLYQLSRAQIGQGVLLILSGGKARAQVLFEQAVALFRRLGDKRGIAIATGYLGHLAALRGDYAKARKLLTESLASPQDLGDDVSIALMYNFLGQIPLRQGDNDAAARLFSQGLDAARRVPDRFPLLISLYDLARSSQAREDLTGAAGFLREGLSAASDAGDESSVGYYLQRLAALARQRDDPGRAVRLLAAADALLQAAGTGWLLAYAATAPLDDDTLPGLRSRMGDATFQQAWAQGAAMGRQRAVEYALQE